MVDDEGKQIDCILVAALRIRLDPLLKVGLQVGGHDRGDHGVIMRGCLKAVKHLGGGCPTRVNVAISSMIARIAPMDWRIGK